MANETVVSDSIDPLSGLNGPLLFPRTIRDSSDRSLPSDFKNLDSIHNFMKSLELRSPEKLMNEAKIILDGGTELLESGLVSFSEKVDITDEIAAKVKDGPKERRPGLGRARKKGSFSLKNMFSQSSVSLEPTLNIDELQDPDEYFDAIERLEYANKEIQKQQGGSLDNLNQYNPSTNARRRRPSILGKSYSIKHRYSSAPPENDDMLASSQETVDQGILSARKDESREELFDQDPNLDFDCEELELGVSTKKSENDVSEELEQSVSTKKSENDVSNILDKLLNNEDLDRDGVYKLLQEQLKIKPLLLQDLYIPELHGSGRTSIFNAGDSLLKSRKRSLVSPMGHEEVAHGQVNTISSPTPPRSPFASLPLLKKRILQSNPLSDPFSPPDVNLSYESASSVQLIDKIQKQVDARGYLSMSSELKSCVEVDFTEPTISDMEAQVVVCEDSSHQSHENASIQRANSDSRLNEVPDYNTEETMNIENLNIDAQVGDGLPDHFVDGNVSIGQENADDRPNEVSDHNTQETMNIENLDNNKNSSTIITDAQMEISKDSLPDQFADGNVSIQRSNADDRPNEVSYCNTLETMNLEDLNDNVAMDDPSSRQQFDAEQQPEVCQPKLQRKKRKAGVKCTRKEHVMKKTLAGDPSSRQRLDHRCEDEAIDEPSKRIRVDQPEVDQVILQRGKREAGENRIRKAHPMRKSIAEAGTSFEAGVRRSKRIKMRPLEFWKGERFLYGRMDNSLKLIGVKYISPGKGDGDLTVKPYLSSESSEFKELLQYVSRH
ncbi:hypothetical protein ACJIZ3_025509 [Penstemon smallii]|uniref:Centromere protein C n=1 Tax=Penstemon smallii TaxID=265156 RepID=A0ABD3TY49_9LAMI